MIPRNLPGALLFCAGVVSSQYLRNLSSPLPFVLRSTYLNHWIPSTPDRVPPAGRWPETWTQRQSGWAGYIRVDGDLFQWQGDNFTLEGQPPDTSTKTTGIYLTPTRTIFTVEAGPVNLNITYLSPIEPDDLVLQSFPFAYLIIEAWARDEQEHQVELYTDITCQWTSSDSNNGCDWASTDTSTSIYHQMKRSTGENSMVENLDLSEDGIEYFATLTTAGLTHMTAASKFARPGFNKTGKLDNTRDSKFRNINDAWPVAAFARDLGKITQEKKDPVVFAMGLVRSPSIRYSRRGSFENRYPYFWTKYNSIGDAIDTFLADFPDAYRRAERFDERLMDRASRISPAYADLVGLSARQAMASVEITTVKQGDTWNTSDILGFVKDTGSSRRVNAVENIYAAFPAYLWLNTTIAGIVLEPLLEYQASEQYQNNYAAPDLGDSFPNAMGNNTNQVLFAVESSGSMLVMALAHAQKSGDGRIIRRHYLLLKEWADYLVANTLHPNGYMTADELSGSPMSNMALKGILGIYAMGRINEILGEASSVSQHYLDTAKRYYAEWETNAFIENHIVSSYGNANIWGLAYNLYAARLLGTDLVPEKIFDAQATWYATQAKSAPKYGFPFDGNRPKLAKSHWTMFTAASIDKHEEARDALFTMARSRAFMFPAVAPNPTNWDVESGISITNANQRGGRASAAMGATFALLAMGMQNLDVSVAARPLKSNVGAIAGGVVAGVGGLLIISVLVFFLIRRRRSRHDETDRTAHEPDSMGVVEPFIHITPFTVSTTGLVSTTAHSPGSGNEATPLASSKHGRLLGAIGNSAGKAGFLSIRDSEAIQAHAGPTSTATNASSSLVDSSHNDQDLRNEVEQLRREMALLRGQHTHPTANGGGDELPPPAYHDDAPNSTGR